MNYNRSYDLTKIGSLPDHAKEVIKKWLQINFVDEFGCELEEVENGGISFSDPNSEIGADDDSFRVYEVTDGENKLIYIAVLFIELPQGFIYDIENKTKPARVIDGDVCDIKKGQEEKVKELSKVLDL